MYCFYRIFQLTSDTKSEENNASNTKIVLTQINALQNVAKQEVHRP